MQQQTAPRRAVTLGVLCLSLVCRRDSYVAHVIIVDIYLTKLRKTENRKTWVDKDWPRRSRKNARKVEACRRLRTSVKRSRNIGLLLIRQLIKWIRRRLYKIVWRPRVIRCPFFDGTAELSSKDSVGRTKRCPFVVDPTLMCNSILYKQATISLRLHSLDLKVSKWHYRPQFYFGSCVVVLLELSQAFTKFSMYLSCRTWSAQSDKIARTSRRCSIKGSRQSNFVYLRLCRKLWRLTCHLLRCCYLPVVSWRP